LSAEISKGALCLSYVSGCIVMRADLPRTDRQLPWPRQRHVAEGNELLERVVSKAQDRFYRPADQLNGNLTQKEEGRNRH
jgi:hypothetical protein